MSEYGHAFPTRLRGYDRDVVDREVRELLTALEHARDDRDRAVARALALEHGDPAQASASVRWLIESAEKDALRIHAEAQHAAEEHTRRAEELLRHRVELIEQAQHEADTCRARAAEEARAIVHDALVRADQLLRGLRESEAALRDLFDDGGLAHRMPPPRRSVETVVPQPAAGVQEPPTQPTEPLPDAVQPPAGNVSTGTVPAGGQHHSSVG